MRSTIRGLVAGLVAAMVALGVAELVAATSARFRSPVLDVGDRVVDAVPAAVKDLAIRWFATNDKVALLVGIGVLLAAFAAAMGILAARGHVRLGVAGIAVFGLVGGGAALAARTDRGVLAVLPSVVGAFAGGAALVVLTRTQPAAMGLDPDRPPITVTVDDPPATAHARRSFLVMSVALGAVAVAAGTAGRWLGGRFSAAASRASVVLPRARRPLPAAPVGIEVGAEGVTPFFTANRDFYRIDTALSVPQVPVDSWRLTIDGMVERPLELSFDELLARPLVEADITMTCVSNEVGGRLVGTARWLGVRLDELLRDVGVADDADQIVGRSVDGYTCGFPVESLDGRDALVAVGMNGEPLPLEHGFPARLIVPGLYGYVSATKWLERIELTRFDRFDQYWVPRGWDARAPIKTSSRIDTPRGLARVPAGTTAVAGVAWAQTRGIRAVEVQVDDSPWTEARVASQLVDTTWRQWVLPWDATPGRHTLTVRATDGTGAIQTAERSEPMPNGSSGLHQIVVIVD